MSDIETPFTPLKDHIDKLKSAVDTCFVPGIYTQTYMIASLAKSIENIKLTDVQKQVVVKLDEQALKQFERLSKGRCSCTTTDGTE
jgi:hypothetical protein